MKNICIVVGSRANYSSIQSVMLAVNNHPNLNLQTVVGVSAILDKYGNVANNIENDGFPIHHKFYCQLEGGNLNVMAKTTGLAIIELSSIFEQLKPDTVVTVGDRYETMATTITAAYMNITLAHTMGGEVTGTIDESIRHATTKFAHLHFPASEDARQRILALGEEESTVFNFGCPRIDLVKEIIERNTEITNITELKENGIGDDIDFEKPFLLISQHPVTTEFEKSRNDIQHTLEAIEDIGIQSIILWPNSDAGTDEISRGMRIWRNSKRSTKTRFYKNLRIETYVNLMNKTACLVGNSSSGIREGAFIGTPCVNIGSRQNMREKASNVIDVKPDKKEIINAVLMQIENGKYSSSTLYGDGHAGIKIAEKLNSFKSNIQKTISY